MPTSPNLLFAMYHIEQEKMWLFVAVVHIWDEQLHYSLELYSILFVCFFLFPKNALRVNLFNISTRRPSMNNSYFPVIRFCFPSSFHNTAWVVKI